MRNICKGSVGVYPRGVPGHIILVYLATIRRCSARRAPGWSLPFPGKPVGTVNDQMPFEHIVVVMMENHSFDNLLGDLGRTRIDVDGLTFNAARGAQNSNPTVVGGPSDVAAHAFADTAQAKNLSQSWKATHEQINDGRMDGFVSSEKGQVEAMGYYPPAVLPFAYSLAGTFTLANRWFCSTPGPTYPNRRFLLAGTAFGGTTSAPTEILEAFENPPASGTICDLLSKHHISWADYSRDIPMTLVLPRILLEHFHHHHRYRRFLADCEAGTLPQVSFVDPKMGTLSAIGNAVGQIPRRSNCSLIGSTRGRPRRTRTTCTTESAGPTKRSKRSSALPPGHAHC